MTKKTILIAATMFCLIACSTQKDSVTTQKKEEVKPQPKPTTVQSERDSRGNYVK